MEHFKQEDGMRFLLPETPKASSRQRSTDLSDENFKRLIEAMHEGVLYSDNNDKILYVNNSFCELTGYSYDELVGRIYSDFLIAGKDRIMMESKVLLRKEGIGDQYELQILRKNGELVWTMVNGIPIQDDEEKVIGSMGTYSVITEVKKTEKRLKAINQELNTFIYKLSHDLRGPVASIKGLANLARTEILDPESLNYIELISKSVHRLDSILTDLLEIVRIKENAIYTESIAMETLVDSILHSISPQEDLKKMKFTIRVEAGLNFVSDKKILSAVIHNTIDNSIKYKDSTKDVNIFDLVICTYHTGIRIIVDDNGVGIPYNIHEKIFDMFYRGHIDSKGTGLGLYIVKNGVEKLGGSIHMESEPEIGTKFVIDIPTIFN